jgi:hypothetical protein
VVAADQTTTTTTTVMVEVGFLERAACEITAHGRRDALTFWAGDVEETSGMAGVVDV